MYCHIVFVVVVFVVASLCNNNSITITLRTSYAIKYHAFVNKKVESVSFA